MGAKDEEVPDNLDSIIALADAQMGDKAGQDSDDAIIKMADAAQSKPASGVKSWFGGMANAFRGKKEDPAEHLMRMAGSEYNEPGLEPMNPITDLISKGLQAPAAYLGGGMQAGAKPYLFSLLGKQVPESQLGLAGAMIAPSVIKATVGIPARLLMDKLIRPPFKPTMPGTVDVPAGSEFASDLPVTPTPTAPYKLLEPSTNINDRSKLMNWFIDKLNGPTKEPLQELPSWKRGETGNTIGLEQPVSYKPKIAEAGSDELSKMVADNYSAKATKLQSVFGPPEDDMAIGTKISDIVQKRSQMARQIAGQPFDKARLLASDPSLPVERPVNLAKAVREIGLTQDNLPPSLRFGKLNAFLRDEASLNPSGKLMDVQQGQLPASVPPAGTVESQSARKAMEAAKRPLSELLDIRQELAAMARVENGAAGTNAEGLAGQVTPEGRLYFQLVKSLDQDIATAAKGTDIEKTLEIGRTLWSHFKDTYGNPHVESLMTRNPSEVAQVAFKSPEAINALRNAGGEDALNLLRKGIANDIINEKASALGNTNIRNPGSVFDRMLAEKSEEMERLFKPKHIDAMRDFASARNYLLRNIPGVPQTSNNAMEKAVSTVGKNVPGVPQASLVIKGINAALK